MWPARFKTLLIINFSCSCLNWVGCSNLPSSLKDNDAVSVSYLSAFFMASLRVVHDTSRLAAVVSGAAVVVWHQVLHSKFKSITGWDSWSAFYSLFHFHSFRLDDRLAFPLPGFWVHSCTHCTPLGTWMILDQLSSVGCWISEVLFWSGFWRRGVI